MKQHVTNDIKLNLHRRYYSFIFKVDNLSIRKKENKQKERRMQHR